MAQEKTKEQELVSKIRMWRLELERQDATMGQKTVFDSMLVFIGEQHREIVSLEDENTRLKGEK